MVLRNLREAMKKLSLRQIKQTLKESLHTVGSSPALLIYLLGYLRWKTGLPNGISQWIRSGLVQVFLKPCQYLLTLILGSSVTQFGQRMIVWSATLLYLSSLYLAVIISGYIKQEFGFHIGIWSGIAFGALVSLVFGYLVLSISIRISTTNAE